MHFNHKVIGCFWQQDQGEWIVKIERTLSDGSICEFEDRCAVLLYGTGLLNHHQWPNIKGLESFKGRVIHTADWPADYDETKWKTDRVAVIGSGASSVQTVPAMQPNVAHIDLFVRTGVWFVNIPSKLPHDHEYTAVQKENFKKDPAALVAHAKEIEGGLGGFFPWMFKNSDGQKHAQATIKKRMAEIIKDERLLIGFTPKWSVGCKRPNPADPYMR
jgi:cation diffusion facilitator CzcD-associated flavoprotein CzcO